MYIFVLSDIFQRKFSKIIPKNKQKDMWSRIDKLRQNPYVGKPLGYTFLRELKLEKFRLYFMISDEEGMILLITVSDKKAQQQTIDNAKGKIAEYREFIKFKYKDV